MGKFRHQSCVYWCICAHRMQCVFLTNHNKLSTFSQVESRLYHDSLPRHWGCGYDNFWSVCKHWTLSRMPYLLLLAQWPQLHTNIYRYTWKCHNVKSTDGTLIQVSNYYYNIQCILVCVDGVTQYGTYTATVSLYIGTLHYHRKHFEMSSNI